MNTKTDAEKPIYFIHESNYYGHQPAYYDRSFFPQAALLEENWMMIKEEMLGAEDLTLSSPAYNPNQAKGADKWKMIIFYNYLWKKEKNCKKYPQTYLLLKQIKGLTFAALNLLEPGGDVNPHHGDTNTTVRCHLGIDIPAPLPVCGLEVNSEQRGWQNGKTVLFNDAHLHRAWNHSGHNRYVFVVDIIRPEYYNQRHWICAGVLGALSVKTIQSKFPLANSVPAIFLDVFYFFIRLLWLIKIYFTT